MDHDDASGEGGNANGAMVMFTRMRLLRIMALTVIAYPRLLMVVMRVMV